MFVDFILKKKNTIIIPFQTWFWENINDKTNIYIGTYTNKFSKNFDILNLSNDNDLLNNNDFYVKIILSSNIYVNNYSLECLVVIEEGKEHKMEKINSIFNMIKISPSEYENYKLLINNLLSWNYEINKNNILLKELENIKNNKN